MKTKNIIHVCLMLITTSVYSQKDSSGIYFTSDDFTNHRLSYVINCKTQNFSRPDFSGQNNFRKAQRYSLYFSKR
ncbi:hypothetical protein SAMN00777080_3372 [Aquiflexum balticum DSM 16537]|jgi:hypothetical protein|uniref:Uncharacterized protein n=1 Tax=Aquiflexum balticum DSM 16537 TaxID=758820 RepID=A0A1W2H758_9BACT|nr:hypothetical protein SAMN00777080_3372 [Aquiflexum balticum DSM 16537]|tara:strand:- start:7118 stop:7342 length:225 start_codon:yes stop_codon:yes gene_type:complete